MVLVHSSKNDAIEEISSCTRYLSLYNPQCADASGLLQCVGEVLKLFGVDTVLNQDSVLGAEGKPVLVGVGTDGATVNIAGQNGLRGQMQRALPWLFWSWCYAHRLELACKDAFTSSLFSSVQEMLLRLYYLYDRVVVVQSEAVGQDGSHTSVRPCNAFLIDTVHTSLTFLP